MDPYRGDSSTTGPCPRCRATLEPDGPHRLRCPAGCGEFHRYEALGGIDGLAGTARDATQGWPWGPAECPACGKPMHVRIREELRFDACEIHGVWFDAGEHARFISLLRGSQ